MIHPLVLWRAQTNQTQLAAAKAMKVSLPTWKHWESGVSFPKVERMAKLTKLTGVTRAQLEAARG